MNKNNLIQALLEKFESDLVELKSAARATYEAATHEESKPENEYDTRGLEASYLAGAQSKRIAEIEEMIYFYKNVNPKDFLSTDAVASTALVQVSLFEKVGYLFIMPKGGGVTISFEGFSIQIVTPQSPLGEALLGLRVGDVALIENDSNALEYEVLSLR